MSATVLHRMLVSSSLKLCGRTKASRPSARPFITLPVDADGRLGREALDALGVPVVLGDELVDIEAFARRAAGAWEVSEPLLSATQPLNPSVAIASRMRRATFMAHSIWKSRHCARSSHSYHYERRNSDPEMTWRRGG